MKLSDTQIAELHRARKGLEVNNSPLTVKLDEPEAFAASRVRRRVVNISVAGVENSVSTQCDWITTAVCNDGSMWWIRNNDTEWREMPLLPQPPNNSSSATTGAN